MKRTAQFMPEDFGNDKNKETENVETTNNNEVVEESGEETVYANYVYTPPFVDTDVRSLINPAHRSVSNAIASLSDNIKLLDDRYKQLASIYNAVISVRESNELNNIPYYVKKFSDKYSVALMIQSVVQIDSLTQEEIILIHNETVREIREETEALGLQAAVSNVKLTHLIQCFMSERIMPEIEQEFNGIIWCY